MHLTVETFFSLDFGTTHVREKEKKIRLEEHFFDDHTRRRRERERERPNIGDILLSENR
jgi:hypothetical protein